MSALGQALFIANAWNLGTSEIIFFDKTKGGGKGGKVKTVFCV